MTEPPATPTATSTTSPPPGGPADTVLAGFTLTAKGAPFNVSDHLAYCDQYEADAVALLEAAVGKEDVTATGML
ncbi:hypothetical protein [Streptomyces beigongshangae]|uniref:hypothetical protein n=1 Tax=Streptomyces beigongshangae TaxID=2841597 RepID=UPI001C85F090|nr:hypothetical protein [Streptomyces sp. REN17]